jgi:hypothetical protein
MSGRFPRILSTITERVHGTGLSPRGNPYNSSKRTPYKTRTELEGKLKEVLKRVDKIQLSLKELEESLLAPQPSMYVPAKPPFGDDQAYAAYLLGEFPNVPRKPEPELRGGTKRRGSKRLRKRQGTRRR